MSNDKYESIKTKLNKLKALAERGYKGEAENAKRLLEKLCAQYGIPFEEIFNENEPKEYVFKIGRRKLYMKLFVQCYATVTGVKQMKYYQERRDTIRLEITPYEAAELMSLYDWHRANFERDIESLREKVFDAYIAKHHLSFRQRNDDDTEEMEELSVEDFRHLQQVMKTMNLLNENKYQKMIES